MDIFEITEERYELHTWREYRRFQTIAETPLDAAFQAARDRCGHALPGKRYRFTAIEPWPGSARAVVEVTYDEGAPREPSEGPPLSATVTPSSTL
jgi:hypothetical protein